MFVFCAETLTNQRATRNQWRLVLVYSFWPSSPTFRLFWENIRACPCPRISSTLSSSTTSETSSSTSGSMTNFESLFYIANRILDKFRRQFNLASSRFEQTLSTVGFKTWTLKTNVEKVWIEHIFTLYITVLTVVKEPVKHSNSDLQLVFLNNPR